MRTEPGQWRHRFQLPTGVRYFDGNSLGLMPIAVAPAAQRAVTSEWAQGLIRSWNDADWRSLPTRTGERIARLIGAAPGQVIACDSTSINLYKVVLGALRLRPGRSVIVTDIDSFPTDLYIVDQLARQFGLQVKTLPAAQIAAAIDVETAVVVMTHVDYRSARIHDMAGLTATAHAAGALMVWDLCHTVGALPCQLDDCAVDFAVGCGYKYLNGGPGSPAWLYVAHRHLADCEQPLSGWFGHRRPFDFARGYEPAEGIERFLCGTSPVVGLTMLHAALDAFEGVEMTELREHSLALTDRFIAAVDSLLSPCGFSLATPREQAVRGSHVALRHADGYAVMQALSERGLIGDFRTPDFLRFGFAPLYNTFDDVDALVDALQALIRDRAALARHREPRRAFT